MIVFVAGMPRSGSTFTFNIVRSLLQSRGSLHQLPVESVLDAMADAGDVDHLLVKGHAADEATIKLVRLGAVKVVCSYRKPEDAVASWMDTFGFTLEDGVHAMHRWFAMLKEIRAYALLLPYDRIEHDPIGSARAIAAHVCPEASVEEVTSICRQFTKDRVRLLSQSLVKGSADVADLGYSHYDRNTFFHRSHVTSVAEKTANDRLDAARVQRIRALMADYCNDDGDVHPDLLTSAA